MTSCSKKEAFDSAHFKLARKRLVQLLRRIWRRALDPIEQNTRVTMTSTKGRSLSPQTSMTLSVSRDDARRMLEASAALNKRLAVLQAREESSADAESKPIATDDPSVPKRVVSASDNESDDEIAEDHQLVEEAASSCGSSLVQSFLATLNKSGIPNHEIRVCLLLFLDMGKSTKLMKAFRTLSRSKEKEDPTKLTIKTNGAVTLFRCLLTAISLCIHQTSSSPTTKDFAGETSEKQPRKASKQSEQSSPNANVKAEGVAEDIDQGLPRASPSFDSGMGDVTSLSEQVRKEIDEIALFASEHLVDHVKKQKKDESASSIAFEDFGNWYNAGGCSIVAWLELLDLTKWEAAGTLNSAEEAENKDDMSAMAQETKAMALETKQSEPQAEPAAPPSDPSPVNFFNSGGIDNGRMSPMTRPIVSFDFTGAMSMPDGSMKKDCPFRIDLSEENLVMLRNLVYRTGMAVRLPHEVSDVLLHHSTKANVGGKQIFVLHRSAFAGCIRELVRPESYRHFSKKEMEDFSICFTDFYSCFENVTDEGVDQVNVKDLVVGFSFLCAGNKSAKLVAGFELLDEESSGQLTKQRIEQYVRSYLKMLVGISLLSASPGDKKELSLEQRRAMNAAVENGARWTIGHALKHFAENGDANKEFFSFEDFATWYTVGGYKVAPWLELLDLSKLLALLGDVDPHPVSSKSYGPPLSLNRLRQTNRPSRMAPSEVLFTFPLANRRSLVVLREDAVYVKSVVEKLALLSMSTEELWSSLFKRAKAQPAVSPVAHHKMGIGKSMDVDKETFVRCMVGIMEHISGGGRKRNATKDSKVSSAAKETLMNFYHSFDLEQVDRVGLNELMGGLCLLCGGKKSTKLAFAFGLFDGRNINAKKTKKNEKNHSLNGEELFLFLRSFLIVMFSCCEQSMDLSAEAVGQYISDSARMVANDVMRFQWQTRKKDRVNFDEFGEWYNEGGFETAPWLELLDLAKWVLADNLDTVQPQRAPQLNVPMRPAVHGPPLKAERSGAAWNHPPQGSDCPPPPPEDALDPSFFNDENPLMQMESIDEMDMMLMQQPSQDKENESFSGNKLMNSFPLSPNQRAAPQSSTSPNNSLKFHLVTYEEHGGYMLSVSQERVSHLRHLLVESGLYQVSSEEASRIILSRATPSNKKGARAKSADLLLTKDAFDSAVRQIISNGRGKANITSETQRVLSELVAWIFTIFDRARTGKACAMEVASGMMVLCAGKKSDKLEYGFEILDKDRQGKLARREMSNYLKSFLTVLLSIASAPCLHSDPSEDSINFMNGSTCDRNPSTITRAAERGSDWAARQAFEAISKAGDESAAMSFDSFADWYTRVGYTSIPWLELLDLRKWVLTSSR